MPQSDITRLLLEAIRYEHWLRFYFLDDPAEPSEATELSSCDVPAGDPFAGDGLSAALRVPDEVAEASRLAEPHLYPLLEFLRDKKVSLEGSRDAVFRHVAVAAGADEPAFGENLFQLVGDPEFRRGLDAFHGWVQELANGDAVLEGDDVPSFARWQAAFAEWAAREAVRHVTTISPFGVKVAFGSDDGIPASEKSGDAKDSGGVAKSEKTSC